MSNRRTRRIYQPWLESGLLPVAIGGIVHVVWTPLLEGFKDPIWDDLRSVLALALTAAGMLVGMQFRAAYLRSAGGEFLRRQSVRIAGQFLWAFVLSFVALWPTQLPLFVDVVAAGLVGALAVVTSQRVPLTASRHGRFREIIRGHVTPCGWWNVIGLTITGIVLFSATAVSERSDWITTGLQIVLPVIMGLMMGRLAIDARGRNEAYLFLLAMLALGGGITLIVGGSPLLCGLLIGAAFNNISLSRSAPLERALEGLEQPMLIVTGFFRRFNHSMACRGNELVVDCLAYFTNSLVISSLD